MTVLADLPSRDGVLVEKGEGVVVAVVVVAKVVHEADANGLSRETGCAVIVIPGVGEAFSSLLSTNNPSSAAL